MKKIVVMNVEKRLLGLENKSLYLSKQLKKKTSIFLNNLFDFGYQHTDVAKFCKDWLEMYDQLRKVEDKYISLSDDLPF